MLAAASPVARAAMRFNVERLGAPYAVGSGLTVSAQALLALVRAYAPHVERSPDVRFGALRRARSATLGDPAKYEQEFDALDRTS
jgi:hypothetical protein